MNTPGPVNVKRYTLYAIIPGLDYYATTQLNKKKPTTIIFVIFVTGLMISTGIIMHQLLIDPELTSDMDKDIRSEIVYEKYMPRMIYLILIFSAIYLPTIAYFVNKWAKEWNKQFE